MYTMASGYELDWNNIKFPYPTENAQMADNDYRQIAFFYLGFI